MLIWLFISIGAVCLFLTMVVLGIILGVKDKYSSRYNDGFEFRFVGSIFLFFAFASLIACVCMFPYYNSSYVKHKTNIMSISREGVVEGHFSLGCGTIKDVQYYFYYYETTKGVLLGKVESEESYIIETSEYVPSIYEVKEKHTLNIYNKIYVPIGTIVTTYVLN